MLQENIAVVATTAEAFINDPLQGGLRDAKAVEVGSTTAGIGVFGVQQVFLGSTTHFKKDRRCKFGFINSPVSYLPRIIR